MHLRRKNIIKYLDLGLSPKMQQDVEKEPHQKKPQGVTQQQLGADVTLNSPKQNTAYVRIQMTKYLTSTSVVSPSTPRMSHAPWYHRITERLRLLGPLEIIVVS